MYILLRPIICLLSLFCGLVEVLGPAGLFQYFIQIVIIVRLYMYISVEILKN